MQCFFNWEKVTRKPSRELSFFCLFLFFLRIFARRCKLRPHASAGANAFPLPRCNVKGEACVPTRVPLFLNDCWTFFSKASHHNQAVAVVATTPRPLRVGVHVSTWRFEWPPPLPPCSVSQWPHQTFRCCWCYCCCYCEEREERGRPSSRMSSHFTNLIVSEADVDPSLRSLSTGLVPLHVGVAFIAIKSWGLVKDVTRI